MRKLNLRIEALEVESFATGGARPGGTVRAHGGDVAFIDDRDHPAPAGPDLPSGNISCDTCQTCDRSMCDSCYLVSCGGCVE